MKLTGCLGLITAFASSLCCTMPLLTVAVGMTGSAGRWSWIDPLRPYAIGLTVGALGWAWYEQVKPQKKMDCGCGAPTRNFWQTKRFLAVATGLALLLLTFPTFANWLIQEPVKAAAAAQGNQSTAQQVAYVTINGMTCSGCEHHVKQEINKLKGIAGVSVSYQKGSATVTYDGRKTSIDAIKKAVDATGYKAVGAKTI